MLTTSEKQELLHEYTVEILTQQIGVKFGTLIGTNIRERLSYLSLKDLQLLLQDIFRLTNLEQLGIWLEHRLNYKTEVALSSYIGILSNDEADELNQIIDSEFEQINPHDW